MAASPGAGGRIAALDGLRGCLACVVVADHAVMELGGDWLGFAASMSVSTFFVISGLVLTRAWDGHYGRFLVRRFLRLWPVFALCLAAGYLVAWRRPEFLEFFWIPYPAYDANEICPPMWSLFIEAWMAFFMPALVWSARGGVLRSVLCGVGCVALAWAWFPAILALRAFVSFSVFFVIGAGLSRTVLRSRFLEGGFAQFLGRISYSLYLTHWLVLRVMARSFGAPGVAVGVVLCFGVAWVVWRLVERPSILLSRRVVSGGVVARVAGLPE